MLGRLLAERDAEIAELKRSSGGEAIRSDVAEYSSADPGGCPGVTEEFPPPPPPRPDTGRRVYGTTVGQPREEHLPLVYSHDAQGFVRQPARRDALSPDEQKKIPAQNLNEAEHPRPQRTLHRRQRESNGHSRNLASIHERRDPIPTQERHGERLQHVSPSLPLPSAVRRMASDADLRPASSRAARRRNLSKHRSMMDLPNRQLQPFVESDVESAAGVGREG
jgi:hypothetical protein